MLPNLSALAVDAAGERGVGKPEPTIKKSDALKRKLALERIVNTIEERRSIPPRKNWLRNPFVGPIKVGDLDPEGEKLTIEKLAGDLCAGEIGVDYVYDALNSRTENLLWTISTAGAPDFPRVVYGFAICKPIGTTLELAIICSMRGGGLALFEEILRWAWAKRRDDPEGEKKFHLFTLDAIDEAVLLGYIIVANRVFVRRDGSPAYTLGGANKLRMTIELKKVEPSPSPTVEEVYAAIERRAQRAKG
jgi:hypothetical protein